MLMLYYCIYCAISCHKTCLAPIATNTRGQIHNFTAFQLFAGPSRHLPPRGRRMGWQAPKKTLATSNQQSCLWDIHLKSCTSVQMWQRRRQIEVWNPEVHTISIIWKNTSALSIHTKTIQNYQISKKHGSFSHVTQAVHHIDSYNATTKYQYRFVFSRDVASGAVDNPSSQSKPLQVIHEWNDSKLWWLDRIFMKPPTRHKGHKGHTWNFEWCFKIK